MANVWKEQAEITENINMNRHDLTFQNNLTMKMGYLYPAFVKEVVPGDTFDVNCAFGFKFMPLVFPVQSQMRMHMHFFYVRNKNLWKNWEPFIQGLKSHVHPYIDQPSDWFRTSSLADYLNVPTALASTSDSLTIHRGRSRGTYQYGRRVAEYLEDGRVRFEPRVSESVIEANADYLFSESLWYDYSLPFTDDIYSRLPYVSAHDLTNPPASGPLSRRVGIEYFFDVPIIDFSWPSGFTWLESDTNIEFPSLRFYCHFPDDIQSSIPCFFNIWLAPKNTEDVRRDSFLYDSISCSVVSYGSYVTLLFPTSLEISKFRVIMNSWVNPPNPNDPWIESYNLFYSLGFVNDNTQFFPVAHDYNVDPKTSYFISKLAYPQSHIGVNEDVVKPYGNDADPAVKYGISALPFRAYESVFNAYYRNNVLNPLIINGEEVYDRYNTTLEDGADPTNYHLFKRNYELDCYTSCLPSPQFGPAPMIGVSALGEVTISDENGVSTFQTETSKDGVFQKIVATSPLASNNHARVAMDMVSLGFNINDFRNGNALTRWVEATFRSNFMYKNFIKGHFNVSPKYEELDMPEFIGGVSQDVRVDVVQNMSSSGGAVLGDYAGIANLFGTNKHQVHHYCDDYGFIMAIVCVVPTPAYSQMLPKMFLKTDPLSYYFHEFSQTSMVPIDYRQVTPIQAYQDWLLDNTKRLTDTFGYQRPNYDMVGSVDEVHGLFRSSLRNFVINRLFGSRPELGSEFIQIDPKEVNDIFVDTDANSDTILGQLMFFTNPKRPIPRIFVPSLGK